MVQFKPKLTRVFVKCPYEKGSMVLVGDHEYDLSSGDEPSGDDDDDDDDEVQCFWCNQERERYVHQMSIFSENLGT